MGTKLSGRFDGFVDQNSKNKSEKCGAAITKC
jgi:hypothetical protein